jgi:hypothetical protein
MAAELGLAHPSGPTDTVEPAPYTELARLASLHGEALETASLIALARRSVWAAAGLAFAAAVVVATRGAPAGMAQLGVWLALLAAGLLVLRRLGSRIAVVPLQRGRLGELVQDLSATLLFTGFVWGAGIALVPPAGPAAAALVTAGASTTLVLLLRMRTLAQIFILPATGLGAFAALLDLHSPAMAAGIAIGGLGALLFARAMDQGSAPSPAFP